MYFTSSQIESWIDFLSGGFPQYFTKIPLPNASVEGRPISALRMRAGTGPERRGVLIVGGTHARELMNPDAIISLAVDLLLSYENGTDIVYGGFRFTADEVKIVLNAVDLWLLPCLNPDGRNYVMTVDDLWRKNRRDNPNTTCDGVDLNRNYDVMWGVTQGQTSCSACSDVFCGPGAFSEPETRNVKALLDERMICCFVDVHSYSELVLWPWGHAPTQTVDPTKNFTTLATGTCMPIAQSGYQEYIDPRDLTRFRTVGQRIVDAIQAVRGRVYTNEPSIGLYPTTGTAGDYAYARHIANPKLGKTYGYTFETGPWTGNAADSFHPADPTLVQRDAKAAMLTLALQCVCAIDLIGWTFLGRESEIAILRRVRDELLASTESGRKWIDLFERRQHRLLAFVIADDSLGREAGALLERVARLIEVEAAVIPDKDLTRAQSFLERLAQLSSDREVAAELHHLGSVLGRMKGRTSADVVGSLMSDPPKLGKTS